MRDVIIEAAYKVACRTCLAMLGGHYKPVLRYKVTAFSVDMQRFCMQVFSTVIAAFGFNGYDYPTNPHNNSFENCQFCQYAYKTTPGGRPAFFSGKVPQARTENVFIDSTIGCT